MALPKSIMAYADCVSIYDKALESVEANGNGMRVRLGSWSAANYFRMRMNNARAINRRDNEDTYEPGHPLYKASPWDSLMVTIKQIDGEHYVYVEPHGVDVSTIEPIPGDERAEPADKPEVHPPIGHVQQVTRR